MKRFLALLLLLISSPALADFNESTTHGTPPIFTDGELADVPSTFTIEDWILPGTHTAVEASGGDFRANCEVSHLGYDDPILYPGQPGASHLHMFYGNPTTDADSTYASLRAAGNTVAGTEFSCSGGPLNGSAYWHPAFLKDGVECDDTNPGTETCAIRPDFALIYYKVGAGKQGVTVRMPRGLSFIWGRNLNTGDLTPTRQVAYKCGGAGAYRYLRESDGTAAFTCDSSQRLIVWMTGPECWNGTDLTSANGRDHVAYTGTGGASSGNCPATHPYGIPKYELILQFSHEGEEDFKEWYLESDRMPGYPLYRNGESMHTDAIFAWDYADIMTTFMQECNGLSGTSRNCGDGVLGDGRKMVQMVADGGPISFTPTTEAGDRYMVLPEDEAPAEVDPVEGYKRGHQIRPHVH